MLRLGRSNQKAVEKSRFIGGVAVSLAAIGALATGALALGAVAMGAVAIGRMAVGSARIKRLQIDELTSLWCNWRFFRPAGSEA